MKTNNLKLLFFGFMMFSVGPAFCQKAMLENAEEIEISAKNELDLMMADHDFLMELQKQKIAGSYTYQITVKEKGMVGSMLFLNKSEDASITGQNYFNNLVKTHKFTFRVPKGNFYKFDYTFIIP